jgi:hypothetical protein
VAPRSTGVPGPQSAAVRSGMPQLKLPRTVAAARLGRRVPPGARTRNGPPTSGAFVIAATGEVAQELLSEYAVVASNLDDQPPTGGRTPSGRIQ